MPTLWQDDGTHSQRPNTIHVLRFPVACTCYFLPMPQWSWLALVCSHSWPRVVMSIESYVEPLIDR